MTKMAEQDVHLHVHHEHGTGGHWCAKVFFFSLLVILLGLVAVIIMENRGLSDSKSKIFSAYFNIKSSNLQWTLRFRNHDSRAILMVGSMKIVMIMMITIITCRSGIIFKILYLI